MKVFDFFNIKNMLNFKEKNSKILKNNNLNLKEKIVAFKMKKEK